MPASISSFHISGIGADAASQSLYIRKRGEGELAVRAAFGGDALLVRPAVMFGPDDTFLTTILRLLTRNQVELMQIDTVSSPEMPGFVELGISPHSGRGDTPEDAVELWMKAPRLVRFNG